MTKSITQYANRNLSYYGALANGSHDDTSNIQDAIAENEAVGGKIEAEPGKTYELTDELVITQSITVEGGGVQSVWGLMDNAESRIIACEIPTKAPYLKGTVFKQNTAGKNVLTITAAGESVNLRHFGIRFADNIRFSNTGHGIRCLPPVNTADNPKREFGMFDSRWDSVFVWGVDGNHYAFSVVNQVLCTFTHLRGFGGGGLELHSEINMTAPGNSVIIHPYFALFAGGTAHGIYIHTDGTALGNILNVFLRPQVNALPGPAAWSLTPLDEINQYRFFADENALKTMLIAHDLENHLVNNPDTLSTNYSMDGFNALGTQAGGASGTKLSNALITAEGFVLNADNGSILAELLPNGVVIKSPDGNFKKIKVANDNTISVEAL